MNMFVGAPAKPGAVSRVSSCMNRTRALILVAASLVAAGPAVAQERRLPNNGKGPPHPGLVSPAEGNRIAWYGTLKAARAEANRTGKPILFVSGAPHCGLTPGVW